MSKKLEEIRRKIDALDDKIHDLLMERADLIIDVSKEKKKSNVQVVQPAREAKMIRRLLRRHRGPLPEAAIVGIWRELVGAVSLLQTGLKVAVSNGEGHEYCWDMARGYFGTVLPMAKASTPLTAISAVRDGDSYFAVVPWPYDGENSPWWSFLVNQDKENPMRIVCALPYGRVESDIPPGAQNRALVVSRTEFLSSGEDHSFIAMEADQSVSRARIFDTCKDLGLEPLGITTAGNGGYGATGLHLVEVNVFVEEGDQRLKDLTKKYEEQNVRYTCIGGYPVPPVYKKIEDIILPEKKKGDTDGQRKAGSGGA